MPEQSLSLFCIYVVNNNKIKHLDIIPEVYKIKPAIVSKQVFPAAFKLLDDSKSDIKAAANKLIKVLYGAVGKSLLESVPQGKVERVTEAIKE